MSAHPTVSVVIPVRDDADALDRCLRLLAVQTAPPLEVVVVDNDSHDHSAQVARRHGARVVTQSLVGIPSAAATGYDAARGDLIARLDADSMPPPDWVERVTRTMSTYPRLDAVTGGCWFYDAPSWLAPLLPPVYLGSYYLLVHAALGHTAVWGSNMALRRTTWQEVSPLVHREDPELHDDMDLSFALGPLRQVRHDRRLVVGVSARSVRGRRQLRRRFDRAVRTLQVNWAVQPPWLRWQARLQQGRLLRSPRPPSGRSGAESGSESGPERPEARRDPARVATSSPRSGVKPERVRRSRRAQPACPPCACTASGCHCSQVASRDS